MTKESEVDVLAVMEDAARRIYVNAETQEDNDASDALLKARAAVAELIEAAIRARRMMRANGLGPGLYDFDSLDAAIKDVGGDE